MITFVLPAAVVGTLGALAGLVSSSSVDPLGNLLSYGPLGVMVVLLVTGILVPKPTHDRVVKENERLRELIDNKVYPAIENSASAVRESSETLKEALRALPDPDPVPRRRAPR